MADNHDQTYIAILGAALAKANLNALVLAENGTNQLGRPHPHHPGYRIWNGNLCRVGHHDHGPFVLEVNAILPDLMYTDMAHHRHTHLDQGTWVYCTADADGAIPITIAITQTRDQDGPGD
ncbi:hypothetical protein ACFRCX_30745 [Streptomyces sp. NPDC056652]|uniref:hypothetical protein n=1 Tax=Streptomyces sp. NPDC056652 TaxID=3345893 RepID=UPI0036D0A128